MIVVLGELNTRVDNEGVNGVKQKYNKDVRNRNGEMLMELCNQNEQGIINTYFPQKNITNIPSTIIEITNRQ